MSYEEYDYHSYETIVVPNPDVLRAGIKHVESHLKYWNQVGWIQIGVGGLPGEVPEEETCGTTACLAGHVLLAQGENWPDLLSGRVWIAERAMVALGFNRLEWRCACDWDSRVDCADVGGDTCTDGFNRLGWDGDGNRFEQIFYKISRSDGGTFEYSANAFEDFRAHVSELTGIEL
jgi:hypothetical protein